MTFLILKCYTVAPIRVTVSGIFFNPSLANKALALYPRVPSSIIDSTSLSDETLSCGLVSGCFKPEPLLVEPLGCSLIYKTQNQNSPGRELIAAKEQLEIVCFLASQLRHLYSALSSAYVC